MPGGIHKKKKRINNKKNVRIEYSMGDEVQWNKKKNHRVDSTNTSVFGQYSSRTVKCNNRLRPISGKERVRLVFHTSQRIRPFVRNIRDKVY